ncbi:MAG: phenylacetate--CoA ligase family protein, partial [Clostridia bacterium]|nr:phenylacetate--CoA ligase family protein [Clostridia bacterium]
SDAFRRRVEKIWGTTANFSFGSTECGALGNECDAHNGYHLMQGHVLVEIIDPVNGNTLPPGETGEIVVTCLLRFDTPLLRYRTGDLGCFDPEPCHCGLSLQRLQLRGRKSDQITINGKVYSPFYLEEFLMRLPEAGNWYQFVVKPGNNEYLKIRTELAPGLQPSVRLAAELAVRMEAASGVPCEIEFVAHLPRQLTKATRVVYE